MAISLKQWFDRAIKSNPGNWARAQCNADGVSYRLRWIIMGVL